jgi:hypothetical protein
MLACYQRTSNSADSAVSSRKTGKLQNERNDPNRLLGRPQGYAQKCNWMDRRLQKDDYDPADTRKNGPDVDLGGSIELFDTPGMAMARRDVIDTTLTGAAGMLGSEWLWLVPENSNLLLRVSGELTRKQATPYRTAMQKVMAQLFPASVPPPTT